MKKRLLHTIALLMLSNVVWAQAPSESENRSFRYKKPTEGYFLYEVPTVINGSNIDPSPYSNFTANTGDASLSFKYGSLNDASLRAETTTAPTLTSASTDVPLIRYYFLQLKVGATDGVSSLFKKGNSAPDVGLSAGFTPFFRSSYWVYTKAKDSTRVGTISTRWAGWVNVRATGDIASYNLFKQESTQLLKDKVTRYPISVFVSYNNFYNSDFNWWHSLISSIYSIGIGYAKTNNYGSLKKRTFEDGQLMLGPNGTTYRVITEETNGALGPLVTYEGAAGYLELYKPLNKLYPDGSQKLNFYLGVRATYYNLLQKSHLINGSGGLFLNIKKGDAAIKRREDALNLALLANFQDLDALNEKHYWRDKFKVSLSASFPLKLN